MGFWFRGGAAESKPLGICQLIVGKPTLLGQPWAVIDRIVIALPALAHRDGGDAVYVQTTSTSDNVHLIGKTSGIF